jgi:hypothetical protein
MDRGLKCGIEGLQRFLTNLTFSSFHETRNPAEYRDDSDVFASEQLVVAKEP